MSKYMNIKKTRKPMGHKVSKKILKIHGTT